MCISIVIFSFGVVQRAILTANIDFKTQTKASAISSIISGTAGVCMAYAGYGVWTLVSQQLLNAGLNTILLWILSSWRPHLLFSWLSFRELFSFGSKLMLVGLLDTLYNNLFQLIIGKFFSSASLGFYSRARHFAEFPSSNISGVLQRVTYPVLCSIQNEDEKLAVNYRKILKMSAFIMFPLMIGLSAVAYPLIELLIGEKWLYAATLLVPICFSMMWYPINSINLSLLQVKGRTDLFLKIEIVKKILGLCILIATIPYGVLAMCYGAIVSTFLSLAINTYYTGVVIHVGFIRQMLDLMPTIVVCGFMFCIVTLFLSWTGTSWLSLISAGLIGAVSYFSVVMLLKFDELHELILIIRKDKGK
jgi:O-antigen/teichoic acid export membrane protein